MQINHFISILLIIILFVGLGKSAPIFPFLYPLPIFYPAPPAGPVDYYGYYNYGDVQDGNDYYDYYG